MGGCSISAYLRSAGLEECEHGEHAASLHPVAVKDVTEYGLDGLINLQGDIDTVRVYLVDPTILASIESAVEDVRQS